MSKIEVIEGANDEYCLKTARGGSALDNLLDSQGSGGPYSSRAVRPAHTRRGTMLTEDGQVLVTDFDYFESEIKKLSERIA